MPHVPGRSPGGGKVYVGLMCTAVVGRKRYMANEQVTKVRSREAVTLVGETSGGKYPDGVAVYNAAKTKLGFIQAQGTEFLALLIRNLVPGGHVTCVAQVDGDDYNEFNFDVAIEVRPCTRHRFPVSAHSDDTGASAPLPCCAPRCGRGPATSQRLADG